MPTFAAVLSGQENELKAVAPFFDASNARIRMRDGEWTLESIAFAVFAQADDVFAPADAVLQRMHQILALYICLYSPLSISGILMFDGNGKLVKRRMRVMMNVEAYSPSTELAVKVEEIPLGNALLDASTRNTPIAKAFALHGTEALS